MDTSLPPSLAYLKKAARGLAALGPDGIDENADATGLLIALKARIADVSEEEALRQLESDRNTLDAWIKDKPQHLGHFISAFIAPTEELVAHLKTYEAPAKGKGTTRRRQSRVELQMDPPTGFVCHRVKGTLVMFNEAARHAVAKAGACGITVVSMPEEDVITSLGLIDRSPDERNVASVSFGPWTGRKDYWAGRIMYHLTCEDFRVQVMIDANGKSIDDAAIEAMLPTLRVQPK